VATYSKVVIVTRRGKGNCSAGSAHASAQIEMEPMWTSPEGDRKLDKNGTEPVADILTVDKRACICADRNGFVVDLLAHLLGEYSEGDLKVDKNGTEPVADIFTDKCACICAVRMEPIWTS
jgi:hypothetical protein